MMSSTKSKYSIVPDVHLDSIQRHDIWYSSLLDGLFNAAMTTPISSVGDSPFTQHMLRWLKVNSSIQMRNALIDFLLHPHIRPYRTRAALGQTKTQRIFSILEMFPLSSDGGRIPNVFGIYLICGHQANSSMKENLVYVG
jgi:hypothetical protein